MSAISHYSARYRTQAEHRFAIQSYNAPHVRRVYRHLRESGLDARRARVFVTDLLRAGQFADLPLVKPTRCRP